MACLSIGTLQTQRRPAYQKGKQKLQKLVNSVVLFTEKGKREQTMSII